MSKKLKSRPYPVAQMTEVKFSLPGPAVRRTPREAKDRPGQFGGRRVGARRDVRIGHQLHALAEPGLHHLQASGEVVTEDEYAVVRCLKAAVQPHAAAAQVPADGHCGRRRCRKPVDCT
jgi:hypothetical protein